MAGDANYTDSVFKFNLANTRGLNGTHSSSKHWIEARSTITITDGRLTVTNASGASNNKSSYVDIPRIS